MVGVARRLAWSPEVCSSASLGACVAAIGAELRVKVGATLAAAMKPELTVRRYLLID